MPVLRRLARHAPDRFPGVANDSGETTTFFSVVKFINHFRVHRGQGRLPLNKQRVSRSRYEYRVRARLSRRIVAGDMSREGRNAGPSKMETFECSLCGIEVSFDYKGRTPPYEKSIVYVPD